jgi:hypothetical protein
MVRLLLVAFGISGFSSPARQENFWHVLAQVSFEKVRDKDGYEIEKPLFSKELKSYHQKNILIKGYIIPVEELGGSGKFMLSLYPFNLCYFCGAAGPETVIEVESKEKIKFTTKQIALEGILILNEKDPDHHIYILKSALLTAGKS